MAMLGGAVALPGAAAELHAPTGHLRSCAPVRQLGNGEVRAQHLEHVRSSGALGSKINNLPSSEFVETVIRRQAVGRRSLRIYSSLDPYEALGVPTTATEKEIKQAYRRLALKLHPDVNKEPGAQQKFMQIKNAYQTLTDEKRRSKYNASKQGSSPSWDPLSWGSQRTPGQRKQDEEFYGFTEFFRDLVADRSKQSSKPKSLWEELADIGEDFVEFLEKELNINDTTTANKEKSSGYEASNDQKKKSDAWDAKKKSDGPAGKNVSQDKNVGKAQVDEIEDMLAKLKKELGM